MKFLHILVTGTILWASQAPYSLDKFKDVLNKCKLQAPTSHFSKYSIKAGDFEGKYNKYFYLTKNYMTFKMCGVKNRSELREVKDWKVDTKKAKTLQARLKLSPDTQEKEFTFIQIHSDAHRNKNPINKPLLRIAWYKNFHGKQNHLWAFVKVIDDDGIMWTKKVDLGKAPKGFFDLKVKVKNNKMNITLNNKTYKFDVSYWRDYWSYFKAGTYLQGDGCSRVFFDKLRIN